MKTSTKFKTAGFILLIIGIVLIILGTAVFPIPFGSGTTLNEAFFVPGMIIIVFSIPLIVFGFLPNITKIGANLHNEALDKAGDEIGTAAKKAADIASPAISTVAKSIKDGFNEQNIFCKKCGKAISEDSKFCRFCGTNQE